MTDDATSFSKGKGRLLILLPVPMTKGHLLFSKQGVGTLMRFKPCFASRPPPLLSLQRRHHSFFSSSKPFSLA